MGGLAGKHRNICLPGAAEMGRKLEEREAMVSQLQRTKNSLGQNVEELKKQLEEENKVSDLSVHQSVGIIYKAG